MQAEIKQRAQLMCLGAGEGKLSYYWLKSSTKNGRFSYHTKTELGVLPFDRLSQKDAGYYQCQVSNKEDQVDSEVVHLKPLLAHALKGSERWKEGRAVQAMFAYALQMACLHPVSRSCESQDHVWYLRGNHFACCLK